MGVVEFQVTGPGRVITLPPSYGRCPESDPCADAITNAWGWVGVRPSPSGLVADFEGTRTADPQTIHLVATSTDTRGRPMTHEWDFGDGTATGDAVDHTFTQSGQVPVTLTTTTDDGRQASVTHLVVVNAQLDGTMRVDPDPPTLDTPGVLHLVDLHNPTSDQLTGVRVNGAPRVVNPDTNTPSTIATVENPAGALGLTLPPSTTLTQDVVLGDLVFTSPGRIRVEIPVAATALDGSTVEGTLKSDPIDVRADIVVNTDGDEPLLADAKTGDHCDVDAVADGDQCTLRAAIELAGDRSAADATRAVTIGFDIPGGGVPVIRPQSPLPAVTGRVTIDGSTQSGGWVEVDGGLQTAGDGLRLEGDHDTVRGLVLNSFIAPGGGRAIVAAGTGGHLIVGNRIGSDPTGMAGKPNTVGIRVESDDVLVGGTGGATAGACTGDCNMVSANHTGLEQAAGTGSTSPLRVEGNWFGPTIAGDTALLPLQYKSIVSDGRIVVGGPTAVTGRAPGNVVGGEEAGVQLGGGTENAPSVVAGNLVGLDASGEHALAPGTGIQGREGIATLGTAIAVVGGGTASERNVVSGWSTVSPPTSYDIARNSTNTVNWGVGVKMLAGAIGTIVNVQNNYVGTDATGTRAVPNDVGILTGDGVVQDNVVSGNIVGVAGGNLTHGNRIGTTPDGRAAVPNGIGVTTTAFGFLDMADDACPTMPCNLVSGNTDAGIALAQRRFAKTIRGTYIGTDVTGTVALPNGVGIDILADPGSPQSEWFAAQYDIGADENHPSTAMTTGSCAYPCNLVSGNREDGIRADLTGRPPDPLSGLSGRTRIRGNVIGLAADGTALPNGYAGVSVVGEDAQPLEVGGPAFADGNVIAANGGAGVEAEPLSTVTILSNRIVGNGGRAIDVRDISAPTLLTASVEADGLHVHGRTGAVSLPVPPFDRVQLYVNHRCVDPAEGEGERPLVFATPLGLDGSFDAVVPLTDLAGGRYLTATRTKGEDNRTGPFSGCLELPAAAVTTADRPVGANEVPVDSNAGWQPGDYARIFGPAGAFVRRVGAIGSLIFDAPLPVALPAGTVIVKIDPPGGDRDAPEVVVNRPLAGGRFDLGAVVALDVICRDAGVGVEQCDHPTRLDTSTVGVHQVVVQAWDHNGNVATVVVPYEVVDTVVAAQFVLAAPRFTG
ncbi:MAG: PKD domain-containing protein [Acidimicrobiia bacterium]